VRTYPAILILGIIGCIADIIGTGLPFLRNRNNPFDVELMYLIQWILIVCILCNAHWKSLKGFLRGMGNREEN
jgi:hypothetical protein